MFSLREQGCHAGQRRFSLLTFPCSFPEHKPTTMLPMIKKIVGVFAFVAACSAASLLAQNATSSKVLTVGTNPEFPPFELVEKGTNKIVGFDVDLITEVAKAAGYAGVKMEAFAFDTLVEALNQKKVDAVIAGMTITDERKAKVLFTEPYYNAAQVLVVTKKNNQITTLDDIKDKRVAVQLGTTGGVVAEKALGQNNSNMKQFRKYTEVFYELKLGRVDVVVVDMPVAQAYLRMKNFSDLKISSKPMSEEEFGIAVAKENADLHKQLNAGLKTIRENGKLDQLLSKWFDESTAEADKK